MENSLFENENGNFAKPVLAAVYVATWEEEGEEPYLLKSDECKPKEHCGDSDWWFDIKTKMFYRYWTYHNERDGLQTVYDEIKAVRLNGC
jgi:hypothetical protein